MALIAPFEKEETASADSVDASHLTVRPLAEEERAEGLDFLAERPLHTIIMRGWLQEYGLTSPSTRGLFYSCRDQEGRLQGVALIGHATLFEARTDAAISAFARQAAACPSFNFVMAEESKVKKFWDEYSQGRLSPRRICYDLLIEQGHPVEVCEPVRDLRPAKIEDLDLIVPAHAELVLEETGVNPLDIDPDGFRSRCAGRIDNGRVWVWVDRGELIFKIDVIASAPDVVYIEGVYVKREKRGMDYGRRCMSQLGLTFLERAKYICGFVNEEHRGELAFYTKIGYRLRSRYGKFFL